MQCPRTAKWYSYLLLDFKNWKISSSFCNSAMIPFVIYSQLLFNFLELVSDWFISHSGANTGAGGNTMEFWSSWKNNVNQKGSHRLTLTSCKTGRSNYCAHTHGFFCYNTVMEKSFFSSRVQFSFRHFLRSIFFQSIYAINVCTLTIFSISDSMLETNHN